MTAFKMGRLAPASVPARDLTHYLAKPLPAPPSAVDAPHLDYPMALNDSLGDCTIAGALHVDQAVADLTREPWTYPGDDVVRAQYLALSPNDTGCVEADVLAVWATKGLFTHKLAGFTKLNVKHTIPIKQTIALCGAAYMGVLLPAVAQQQFASGESWHLTHTEQDYNIVGGHCIVYVGYNATGPIAVSWGRLVQLTWEWHLTYAEEGYCVIAGEIKDRGGLHGVNFDALEKDLASLRVV